MQQPPLIEAQGLAKWFGRIPAVTGFDMSVPAGTICCLLGPNGAGKTTVVRMLTTLVRPDAGRARVAGHDVVAEGAAVRREIGLSGQYASVDEFLTGRANLVMIGELCRMRRAAAKRRTAELLTALGLEQIADRPVRTYSGGMRRRLDIAASLIGRPSVLFLDEPTTGLDPRSRLVLWQLIRDLVRDGTTLLLTTQYLEEADHLADRISVMRDGRVVAEGTPAELKSSAGSPRLVLTLGPGAHLGRAASIVARHATGPALAAGPGRLELPVAPRAGLISDVVRDLDAAGILVDAVTTGQPSLDDAFHMITGSDREAA